MEEGAGISDTAARQEIAWKALNGESEAWASLMKEPWAYLDEVIKNAAGGDQEALKTLLNDPWLYVIFCRIAEWAERKYEFVHDLHGADLPEVLSTAIRLKITELDNRNNVSWRACLRGWAFTVGRCYSLNHLTRGRRDEEKYQNAVAYEHTPYKRGGKGVPEPGEVMSLPQEEAEKEKEKEKEEARREVLRKRRAAVLKEAIWRVYAARTQEEQAVLTLWAVNRMTYQKIADKLGTSRTTVWRALKVIFKSYFEEIGQLVEELERAGDDDLDAGKVLDNLMEHRAEQLRKLIAVCLQDPSRFGPGLPLAA
jgi:DNA-directed RNA polymerase specialized sigma24 family protein